MVLRVTLFLVALLVSSCVHAPQSMKLSKPSAVHVAYVLSYADKPEVVAVPDEVAERIGAKLGARNLQPKSADFTALSQPFERKRSTQDRLEVLNQAAATAGDPFVMLVEATPRYYSLLSGRYRWNVDLRITLAATDDLANAQTQDWGLSAFLDFSHQDELDALEYSAGPIADRVGRLTDQFLSGFDGLSVERAVVAPAKEVVRAHPLAPGSAIYFAMVDRFHNGEPANDGNIDLADPHGFHGGDLQGLASKLDWLGELGITTLWLSPIFEMRTEKFHGHGAFHGYWVEDPNRIEPRFGGEAGLEALRKATKERQMSLLFDVVLNHTAMDGRLLKEHPDWYHGLGGITDWSDPTQILTHDVHGLPDLAVEKPEVYDFLLESSLRWVDKDGPAGFRLDAVKHVPHEFWTAYNKDIKKEAGNDFVLLGEDLDGDPARVAATMRTGKFDAMFDFPLHFAMVDVFCRDAHPGRLASILFADRLYPDAVGKRREGLVTLLDNHDLPRILSACGNDEGRVVDALRFMLTARGTPSFTWGTESGATGAQEPDNRADMRFAAHPMGDAMKRWLKLRREHEVLTHGRDHLLELGPSSFVYARVGVKESIVVSVNLTNSPRILDLPDAQWTNLETGAKFAQPQAAPGVTVWSAAVSFPIPAHRVTATFAVTGAPDGEVRIAGSGPELGNWDPGKAPRAGAVKLPRGGAFAFKPVVVKPDGSVAWDSGANHYLLVGDADEVELRFAP